MPTRVRSAGATTRTVAAVTRAIVTRAPVTRVAATASAVTTIAFTACVAMCSAGCARGTSEGTTSSDVPAVTVDVVPPTTTSPAHSAPSGGSEPTPAPSARGRSAVDHAVARCERALDRAVSLSAGDAFAAITAGCADLFSRAPCRDAFRDAASTPVERRGASLAKACADAYCPALPPPAPELCAHRDPLPPPGEMARMWGELHRRILVEELGEPRAEVLLDRQELLGRPRQLHGETPECHPACCGPNQQGPAPDGTDECCLCDPR